MDLKVFYNKLREVEGGIQEPFPTIVSLASPDGGKEGVLTETSRRVAAKMVVQGRARLATTEEGKAFRQANEDARRKAEQEAAAAKLQLTVLTPADFNRLRNAGKPAKE